VPTALRPALRRRARGDADRRDQLQPQPRPRADLPARRPRPGGDGAHLQQPVRPAPDAGALSTPLLPAISPASPCRSRTRADSGGPPSSSLSRISRRSPSTCPGKAARRLPSPSRRSGVVTLDPGRMTLTTRYPLGLFRAWSYPYPPFSCIVYPKPLRDAPADHRPTRGSIADHRQGDSGQEDFAGLRPRELGDPTRHIAWKAVARRADEQPCWSSSSRAAPSTNSGSIGR
jgi:hypothetical protein